jgi:hypothetical protein
VRPPASDAGVPPMCPSSPGDSVCVTCINQRCCAQLTACVDSSSCVSLLRCLNSCPENDAACVNRCAAQYADGVDPLLSLLDCRDVSCGQACVAPPPPDAGPVVPADARPPTDIGSAVPSDALPLACQLSPGAPPCDVCVSQQCCGQIQRCYESPACDALVTCLAACPDTVPSCQSSCTTSYPGGLALLNEVVFCVSGACTAACQ